MGGMGNQKGEKRGYISVMRYCRRRDSRARRTEGGMESLCVVRLGRETKDAGLSRTGPEHEVLAVKSR